MGLAVKVGVYARYIRNGHQEQVEWFDEVLDNINEALEEEGEEIFEEPRELDALHMRVWCDSLSYSDIHYLRRLLVHIVVNPDVIPAALSDDEDPTEDPLYVEQQQRFYDWHLIAHSDAEGLYLPINLNRPPIYDFEVQSPIWGGILGCSYRLMDELVRIAPKLGIKLTVDNKLTDEEANKVNELAASQEGFYREYSAWIILFEASRLSIEYKTAIMFT